MGCGWWLVGPSPEVVTKGAPLRLNHLGELGQVKPPPLASVFPVDKMKGTLVGLQGCTQL